MAKLEDQLAQISALPLDMPSDSPEFLAAIKTLDKALKSASNHVIAKAAQRIAECRCLELCDAMAAAFDRLLTDAPKRDKGGTGLTELARTLALLGYDDASVFERGSRHVQMEPVYGGKVDVADHLRGWCAQGLAQTGDPDALTHIARLLADPCPQTRKVAVQAIGVSGRTDIGLPLLNLKLTMGDVDPQVIGRCVTVLLEMTNGAGLYWIKPLLNGDNPAQVEQVLLAMGQSRSVGNFECLANFYDQTLDEDIKKTTLLAIAMLRCNDALSFLCEVMEEGSSRAAGQVIEALGIYSYDSQLGEKLAEICRERQDDFLLRQVQTLFGL